MMTKIEWYQEVLALEPNSKVFFPLAQLLIENGELSDAAQCLTQGVERHPEYVEAKLLLVDVLHQLGRPEDSRRYAQSVGAKIAAYPDFWRQWAQILSEQDKGRDLGLAVQFMASFFQGAPISFVDIFELGLRALSQQAGAGELPRVPVAPATAPAVTKAEPVAAPVAQTVVPAVETTPAVEPAATPLVTPLIENVTARVLASEPGAAPNSDFGDDGDDELDEETFSLRTRTMADLLAEQGDHAGALDIYRELHAAAENEAEKTDLARRIDKMIARMQEVPAKGASSRAADEDEAPPSPQEAGGLHSKKKLMNALEKLAQRLEARAAG